LKRKEDQTKKLQTTVQKLKQNESSLINQIGQLKQSTGEMLVQEGTNVLRSHLFDEETEIRAFFLFKKAADECNDIEACWRVAACFLRGIGTRLNSEIMLRKQWMVDQLMEYSGLELLKIVLKIG
jgi:hypothetical protein